MVAKNHGHVVIIASQGGFLATAGIVDYSATKSAAIAIYEGLQSEVKHYYNAPAVRVSCINPSVVKTAMFAGAKGESSFMLPKLDVADIGGLVVDILWGAKARNVMIPAMAYISAPTKIFPEWLRIAFQDGGADIMTTVKPHRTIE